MDKLQMFAAPAGRILLALIFVASGLNKIGNFAGTQGYMDSMGVPGVLLPLVILVEVLAGVALMVGWKVRAAAFLLAAFTFLATILFHANMADQMQMIMAMKNLSIIGGLLMVMSLGAGSFALDNRVKA